MTLYDRVENSSHLVPLFAATDFDGWNVPLNKVIRVFDEAFEHSMCNGDSFAGVLAFACTTNFAFCAGYDLRTTLEDMKILLNMVRQYNIAIVGAM